VSLPHCCVFRQRRKTRGLTGLPRNIRQKIRIAKLPDYLSDSVYTKKMKDAMTYKGKIVYEKYKSLIRKDKSENPIEIDNREIGKTIKFATKNKTDLSLVVNRGLLIKIK
jgi:hypothetical protein